VRCNYRSWLASGNHDGLWNLPDSQRRSCPKGHFLDMPDAEALYCWDRASGLREGLSRQELRRLNKFPKVPPKRAEPFSEVESLKTKL
jgi:hypothetical protein